MIVCLNGCVVLIYGLSMMNELIEKAMGVSSIRNTEDYLH